MGSLVEGLFPVVRYQVGKITSTTALLATGYYQASLFAAPGHFIGTLRPEVSWFALSKATLFTNHSRGARGCAIPLRRSSAHTDSFKLLLPIDAIEIRRGFTRLPGPEITSPLQVLPSITFDDFLSAQPSWTQRLLQILDPKFSYPTIHHHLHTSTPPLADSDGSVLHSQGTSARFSLPPNLPTNSFIPT
jgi:hypothetical protein